MASLKLWYEEELQERLVAHASSAAHAPGMEQEVLARELAKEIADRKHEQYMRQQRTAVQEAGAPVHAFLSRRIRERAGSVSGVALWWVRRARGNGGAAHTMFHPSRCPCPIHRGARPTARPSAASMRPWTPHKHGPVPLPLRLCTRALYSLTATPLSLPTHTTPPCSYGTAPGRGLLKAVVRGGAAGAACGAP